MVRDWQRSMDWRYRKPLHNQGVKMMMDNEVWSDTGICNRCGRELADELSLDRGYGPICWKKVQEEQNAENDDAAVSAGDSQTA